MTQEELDNYKSTGKAMKVPKASAKSLAVEAGKAPGVNITYKPSAPVMTKALPVAKPRLYVHVKNPDDHEALLKLKQSFNSYPGSCEVVLVLGEDKKSALRLPFTVEPHEGLKAAIGTLFGQECVALK